MRRLGNLAAATLISSLIASVSVAEATENGLTLWPQGVQTVASAILPPPGGIEYYQYNLYYSASSFKNNKGQSLSPNIGVDFFGHADRLEYTWPTTYGNWNFSSQAIMTIGAPTVQLDSHKQTNVGVTYLYFTPIQFTYNTPNFHLLIGEAAYIPVSSYDPTRFANASLNYYGFNQEIAVTWFPTPRWEVSAQANFTINGRNPATNYLSGAVFALDYGINYKPFENISNFQVGLAGFVTEQLSSDELAGLKIGNHIQAIGVGPQFIYYMTPAAAIVLKWQHAVFARNTTNGDRVWLEFAFPLM